MDAGIQDVSTSISIVHDLTEMSSGDDDDGDESDKHIYLKFCHFKLVYDRFRLIGKKNGRLIGRLLSATHQYNRSPKIVKFRAFSRNFGYFLVQKGKNGVLQLI